MKKYVETFLLLIVVTMPMIIACGSDSDTLSDSMTIPSGRYVEENGDPMELYTMVVNGYNITITVTEKDYEDQSWTGTYRISGNTIFFTMSNGTTESAYFNMSGGKVTIGEITYVRQV